MDAEECVCMWPVIAATAVQLVFLLGFSRQSCAERNGGLVGSRARGWTDGPVKKL